MSGSSIKGTIPSQFGMMSKFVNQLLDVLSLNFSGKNAVLLLF